MKLQQRCWLDERAKLRDPAPTHEQRGQAEYDAIRCREIRSTLSGAIANEQLMLQQQRLCGNGTDATRAEQSQDLEPRVVVVEPVVSLCRNNGADARVGEWDRLGRAGDA